MMLGGKGCNRLELQEAQLLSGQCMYIYICICIYIYVYICIYFLYTCINSSLALCDTAVHNPGGQLEVSEVLKLNSTASKSGGNGRGVRGCGLLPFGTHILRKVFGIWGIWRNFCFWGGMPTWSRHQEVAQYSCGVGLTGAEQE